ncbi:hypothetical protein AGMMS49965_00870 [Bacteroidia bacterium]|nr:hypothetical protein AGMMS49965_00870 [Bacteroidia bacterium]
MKYSDFEYIMSATRMNRYLLASNNNSKKAMTLYRKNLHLSQELFTVISCFEVAFRNAINMYNHTFVFNQLEKTNNLRNRIAHHEPICFLPNQSVIDTTYARQHYNLILQLFQWMNIDELSLLYGLDHITTVCNEIDAL